MISCSEASLMYAVMKCLETEKYSIGIVMHHNNLYGAEKEVLHIVSDLDAKCRIRYTGNLMRFEFKNKSFIQFFPADPHKGRRYNTVIFDDALGDKMITSFVAPMELPFSAEFKYRKKYGIC